MPRNFQIYRGPNYLEVDIDVAAHFTYLSQRGICWALGLCDRLEADIAFVIEVGAFDRSKWDIFTKSISQFHHRLYD
jgi:hypothetical protein